MAVKLHEPGYEHAQELIAEGKVVIDDRDQWSEHQPSAAEENAFIEEHGYRAYGRWHLAVDDEQDPNTKGHYKFPYGDFEHVHRCGVLAAESRAGQRDYSDVQRAAMHLHGMLEGSKQPSSR
jgi:hypothetical protein